MIINFLLSIPYGFLRSDRTRKLIFWAFKAGRQ